MECGSITAAAAKSGYTVSGISRIISSLEKEQGFPLLYRNHDGVKAAPELEILLPHIREMIYQEKMIEEKRNEIKGIRTGKISIGIAYSSYYGWLAEKTKAFANVHEGVRFQYISGYSSELLEKMNLHELDLCLITEREGTEAWIPLGHEELVAWVPETHSLAKKKSVDIHVFETEPYIDIYPGKDIDNRRIFEKYHIQPNAVINTEDSFTVYSMVEAGLGISMNHRSNSDRWKGKVAVVNIKQNLSVPVGLASLKVRSPLAEAFWKFCRE